MEAGLATHFINEAFYAGVFQTFGWTTKISTKDFFFVSTYTYVSLYIGYYSSCMDLWVRLLKMYSSEPILWVGIVESGYSLPNFRNLKTCLH